MTPLNNLPVGYINEIPAGELKGKKVIVRCDFNVQVFEGRIMDDLRIRKTLPTIKLLRDGGAKIILISHIESKDGTGLHPVCEYINETYKNECGTVKFVEDFRNISNTQELINTMSESDVVLFENLRIDSREKTNDPEFSKLLASYGEMYINDAFAVSHRAHSSVVGLPLLFSNARYGGLQLAEELTHLEIASKPPHPFVFILGGAKFETKLPLIQKFNQADHVLLGGALLNDILKAKGLNVGKSLVSGDSSAFDISEIIKNKNLIIPEDVVVLLSDGTTAIKNIENVGSEDMIMDVGPSMTKKLDEVLKDAKFVLWNGPMGNYEKGFKDQTIDMAKSIARVCLDSDSNVQAVLGGGDTTAAVAELGLEAKDGSRMFISTGGGAMLEYLLNETLPGVEALRN